MLYYSYPQVVLQEVPDEISLALSMSGCGLHCKGCHSQETWKSTFGEPLTVVELNRLLRKHKHITCVLFYGGEWQPKELIRLLKIVKDRGLNTCLYTGLNYEEVPKEIIGYLDYIKVGRYVEELGGLDSPTTNQRFIDLRKKS